MRGIFTLIVFVRGASLGAGIFHLAGRGREDARARAFWNDTFRWRSVHAFAV